MYLQYVQVEAGIYLFRGSRFEGTPLPISGFVLDEMFQQNATKFAVSVFHFVLLYFFPCQNFEAFCWNFLSSTIPEIGMSGEFRWSLSHSNGQKFTKKMMANLKPKIVVAVLQKLRKLFMSRRGEKSIIFC